MNIRRRKRMTEQTIDMSPLIDMVFILLIFFMVTTTFNKDMKVQLERPSASSEVVASQKAIRIFIDQNSEVYLDQQPIRVWVIQSRLRELLQDHPDGHVLVVTDKMVSADRLIEVVDQARLAGAKEVAVATKHEAGSGAQS